MKGRSDWSLGRSPPDGDNSPPTELNVAGDFEENSWGRSLMMLDGVNGDGSPTEGNFLAGGTSVGGTSILSLGRDSAGSRSLRSANIDPSMQGTVPSILSTIGQPTQVTSLPSESSTAQNSDSGNGTLNQYLNNPNSQHAQRQPQVQVPTQQPQPNLSRSAYDQYFSALQANFRLAQAQAERDLNQDAVPSSTTIPMAVQQLPTEPTVVPGKRRRSPGNNERESGTNHANSKESQQVTRNSREKNRAQKITDLIDQIRVNMEEDGRTLEVHSKFNVLSKCAIYLKEIVQATETKERSVQELQTELKDLQQKLEEKKVPRADYDSVTSSLTSTSTHKADGIAGSRRKSPPKRDEEPGAPKNLGVAVSVNASTSGGSGSGGGSGSDEYERVSDGIDTREASTAKVTVSGSDSSRNNQGLTSDSSKNNEGSSQGLQEGSARNSDGTNVISTGKVTTSGSESSGNNGQEAIFEMNDKNDSSSGGSSVSGSAEMEDSPTTSTFVSDAAVKSQKSSRVNSSSTSHNQGEKESTNSDLSSENKNPPHEIVAFERTFTLEYETIFLESGIPQIVSLPSGRIVAGNHAFLRMAGLRFAHVGRISLFSLVRPEHLSELFEVLSRVLGTPLVEELSVNKEPETKPEGTVEVAASAASSPTDDDSSEEKNTQPETKPTYQVMTLPCVEFPLKKRKQGHKTLSPLYVTITMLGDVDPQKRCIHSVFSDYRGTNGKVGVLTPALMEAIFSEPLQSDKAKRKEASSQPRRGHGQHPHHRGMEVSFHQKILPSTNRESTSPVPSSAAAMDVAQTTEDNPQ